jgi:cysteine desulfurase / selenocysteine lyase
MSNVLGTINPAAEIIRLAHEAGAITLVDGAQSVPHFAVDVQALDVDFLAFSAHKMVGPTGIGALYGKQALAGSHAALPRRRRHDQDRPPARVYPQHPAAQVRSRHTGYCRSGRVRRGCRLPDAVGMDAIAAHEHAITEYALERLEEVPGLRLFGPGAQDKGGVAAFTFDGVHPHDVAQILDRDGIAVRAGHHCAQPLHENSASPPPAAPVSTFTIQRMKWTNWWKGFTKSRKFLDNGFGC